MCNCKTLFGVSKEAFHGVTQSFYFSENKLLLQLVKLIATLAFLFIYAAKRVALPCNDEVASLLSSFNSMIAIQTKMRDDLIEAEKLKQQLPSTSFSSR